MAVALVVAFLVVPLVEIYVLIQVGQVIGALPAILLLLAISVLGAWLVRREGIRVWRTFRAALARGEVPTRQVADSACVLAGGALLLTPGFVTDALGLLLVIPLVRVPTRVLLTSVLLRRMVVFGGAGGRSTRGEPGRGRGSGAVIDGDVVGRDVADTGPAESPGREGPRRPLS